MYKTIVTIACAAAMLSLASLSSVQAGNGAPGTPSKYQTAANHHSTPITEFSSSSAHGPKR